ncbi:MAG: DNA polymerase III subunit gamma/tau, partial [Candidatus Anoxymicrobium japonicum]
MNFYGTKREKTAEAFMKHISLYRKWRPGVFNEVIGQGRVTDTLMNALTSGRVVHAYLFSGPRGTGKTSTARILAKAINCAEGPTAKPCGVCEACVSISEGTALDVIEIDAASNRKIDEMRDLLDKIPYRPTSLRTKVYIVDEAHQLTNEASSALLKTLEEPPGHVVFILATTEPHKLLPTIVSRCQKYDFSLVSAREISRLLEHIASREEIDIETDALGMIAEHARGSVRDAIGVMDQISNMSGEHITSKQLAEMLGEVEIDLVFETVDFIIDRDTPGVLTLIGKMIEDGKAPRRFVESLIGHLRSLFLVQNAANPSQIVEATEEHYARLAEQANRLRRHEVIRLIERLGDTHREMRQSENPRLVLECALVKITSLDADATLAGLAFR